MGKLLGIQSLLQGSLRKSETFAEKLTATHLLHYRGNWYLIAWYHLRDAIRPFAMDAIESATTTAKAAKELPKKEVEQFVGKGYGIFSGEDVRWARLRFTPEKAR